jgi:hypothetical protein
MMQRRCSFFAINAKTLTLSPSATADRSNPVRAGEAGGIQLSKSTPHGSGLVPCGSEKNNRPSVYKRECARSVRKTGFRLQTSSIRKRGKNRPTGELGKVKKIFKIPIFGFWNVRAQCHTDWYCRYLAVSLEQEMGDVFYNITKNFVFFI